MHSIERLALRSLAAIAAICMSAAACAETAYVSDEMANVVHVIDAPHWNTPPSTIPVGTRPRGMVLSHDGTRLYVAVGDPGVVQVVDGQHRELLETVPTEQGAHTIGWDPESRGLYAFLPSSEGAAVFLDP